MTKRAKMRFSIPFLGIAAFGWAACGGSAVADDTACVGHADPEQAYTAFVDAIKANDWSAANSYVEPDSRAALQKVLVSRVIVTVGMASEEAEWRKLMTVLMRHGFQVNAEGQLLNANKEWPEIDDWPGLMRQIAEFSERTLGQRLAPETYELTDIKMTGEKATARLKLRKGKEKTLHFKKTESSWCLAAR
jgi:crotonobetainyl-CoA:carnitine CoA-transferase CaiB-like acyl-CoA transferase